MRGMLLMVLTIASGVSGVHAAAIPFELNKDHTDLMFEISHAGYTMKHGWFRNLSGTLSFDENKIEASRVDVTIKASSVDTNHAQRDKDLSGPGFLDVAQFPELHFVSTKITRDGERALIVEGSLTMHGITRPLLLQATLNKVAPNPFTHAATVGFTASAQLKRSDFGVTTLIPIIGDDVSITIDAEFSAASPSSPK